MNRSSTWKISLLVATITCLLSGCMSGSTDLEYGTVELNLDNADSIVMVSILVERSDIVVFS